MNSFLLILLSLVLVVADNCTYQQRFKRYALRSKKQPYPEPEQDAADGETLLDLPDFEFTINSDICSKSNPLLLILVMSTPHNNERRHAIRTTWGQSDDVVKTLFVVGTAADRLDQKAIELESRAYGDIVQGNFIDSYRNLTYKSVMALKYVRYHCLNTAYVLKTTDDVFVNKPMLRTYLVNDLSPNGAHNYLLCHIRKNSPIVRDEKSKWYVSLKELSGDVYPPYCHGPFVLQSTDVATKLYVEAQKSKFFVIDDVFLYDMVLSTLPGIEPIDMTEFSLSSFDRATKPSTFNNRNFLFAFTSMSVDQILEFWTYALTRPVRSSIYDYYNFV